jgi:hypothetical protein
MSERGRPWVFTKKRQASLKLAQRRHVEYVELGKEMEKRRKAGK